MIFKVFSKLSNRWKWLGEWVKHNWKMWVFPLWQSYGLWVRLSPWTLLLSSQQGFLARTQKWRKKKKRQKQVGHQTLGKTGCQRMYRHLFPESDFSALFPADLGLKWLPTPSLTRNGGDSSNLQERTMRQKEMFAKKVGLKENSWCFCLISDCLR